MLLFSLSSVVLYGTSPVTVKCGDPIGFLQSTAQEWLFSEAERLSSLYLGRDYSISSLEIFIALLTSSNTREPLKISKRRDILRFCSRYLGKSD